MDKQESKKLTGTVSLTPLDENKQLDYTKSIIVSQEFKPCSIDSITTENYKEFFKDKLGNDYGKTIIF